MVTSCSKSSFSRIDLKEFTRWLNLHPKTWITCINLLVLTLAYWRFFNVHYSADTYIVYYLDDAIVNIKSGRPLGFVASKLNYFLSLNTPEAQPFVTFLFLLTVAICTTFLTSAFIKHSKQKPTAIKMLICDLIVALVFVNGFFLDWMRFPETYTMLYAPALILLTIATFLTLGNTKINKRSWFGIAFALLLASWFYQTVLFMYLQFALANLIISHRDMKNSLKLTLKFLLMVAIVGIVSIVGSKIVFTAFVNSGLLASGATMRESVYSLHALLGNIEFIIANLGVILLTGNGNEPQYLLLFDFLVLLICLSFTVRTINKNNPKRLIFSIVCIIAILSLSFAPQLINSVPDLSPRVLVGIYVAFSSLALLCFISSQTKIQVKSLMTVVIVVTLFANIYTCNAGTKVELELNSQEHEYSDLVQAEIENYERESGNTVRTIARTCDSSTSKNLRPLTAGLFSDRSWSTPVYWTTTFMINTYENKRYEYEEMEEADKERLFGNVNYDSFDASKQLFFEGNKLYLLVY